MMRKRDPVAPVTPDAYAAEAVRYYRNARQILRAAPIRQDRYLDVKPVREACATAYLAVLAAVRSFLLSRGVQPDRLPESYEAYCQSLHRHNARNGLIMHAFFHAYSGLHLDGYYRGLSSVELTKVAFQQGRLLIERLTGRKVEGA
jgi:uncharacterized protein (UPF0332 family)